MTRTDLIERLARNGGLPPESARRAVEALFGSAGEPGVIGAALRDGERVQLTGFGTFETRQRKERQGSNPQTGAPLTVPGGIVAAFRPAAALREQVRGSGVAPVAPAASPARVAPESSTPPTSPTAFDAGAAAAGTPPGTHLAPGGRPV